MYKILIALAVAFGIAPKTDAQTKIVRTTSGTIQTLFDGGKEQTRRVIPSAKPEELITTASELSFLSDTDTLHVKLDEWQSAMVCMVDAEGDSSYVHIYRRALNPFENPSPEMRAVSLSGMLSREQAIFDIDALVDGISNVHPDMFSVCPQVDFFHAVKDLKQSLPDSVSTAELYLHLTPVVAMLADGHTHLLLPEDNVLLDSEEFMPLYVKVTPDRKIRAVWCAGDAVPAGAEILVINGLSADSIIGSMLPLQSGERDHFRLMRVDADFTGLFHLMYPATKYNVGYRKAGSAKVRKATLQPAPWADIKEHFVSADTQDPTEPYSYTIDKDRDLAIMEFRACYDPVRMEAFADSMFRELRQNHIGNLIIDVRENGGGNSQVGDVVLRYICPEPFTQMDKMLMRITPFTARLMNARNATPMFDLYEVSADDYQQPRSATDGFYDGNVYLLTSGKTFSAAASFAWVFAECKIGPVIGEETGGMNVSYGDKVWYTLPLSGLECGISFKRFWQFRADDTAIHGAMPTVAAAASDALAKAISIIETR